MRSRSSLIISIIVLLLAAFSIGGATMAWFTTEVTGSEGAFTAGTVQIAEPQITAGGDNWEAGQWNTVQWDIASTGSLESHLRVRPILEIEVDHVDYLEDDSIWCAGQRIVGGHWSGRYFTYTKGEAGSGNPRAVNLFMGPDDIYVGYLEVWDDGNNLYLNYKMHGSYILDQTQICASIDRPNGNTHRDYQQYPWHFNVSGQSQHFSFETGYVYDSFDQAETIVITDLDPGSNIFIAVHGNAYQVSDLFQWRLGLQCEPDWYPAEGHFDGWWYYGAAPAPYAVMPLESVAVCYEFYPAVDFNGSFTLSFEAEAVQAAHGAIHHAWPTNPWNTPVVIPSLNMEKQADRDTAALGDTINYTIDVINDGNVTLTNISVKDSMLGMNQIIASLAPGGTASFSGSHTVSQSDLPGPLVNAAVVNAEYDGQAVSASSSVSVSLEEVELIPFADIIFGSYVYIPDSNGNGVLFQKIGEDWMLLRGTSGQDNQNGAATQGINYAANFPDVALSSRILTGPEAEALDQEEFRAIGVNWWTSSGSGNQRIYINSDGATANSQQGVTHGVRPSLFLDLELDLYVMGGDGTSEENAYTLVIP